MLECGLCCKTNGLATLNEKENALHSHSHRAIDNVSHRPLSRSLEDLRRRQRDRPRPKKRAHKNQLIASPSFAGGIDPTVLAAAEAAIRRREANRALQQGALDALHALAPGTDCPEISRVIRRTDHPSTRRKTNRNMASTARPAVPPRHPGRLKQARTSKPRGSVVVTAATSARKSRPLYQPRSHASTRQSPRIRPGSPSSVLRQRAKAANPPRPPSHCSRCGSVEPGMVVPNADKAKLWDAVRRSLSQQSRVSSIVSPLEALSITSAGPAPVPPSRTSSQQRALDQFVRQLETYADRRGVAGKVPVFTPTPESVLSYHTVSALLPYEADLQKAGLAVTSCQQARHSPTHRIFRAQTPEALGLDGQLVDKPLPKLPRRVITNEMAANGVARQYVHATAQTADEEPASDNTEVVFTADDERWDSA
jgi:hypothetical protein